MALRGVVLVVDDVRKGPKLAFSYPLAVGASSASADALARLLRPRPQVANQLMTLTVDDTTYVSYPVLLPQAARRPPPPAAAVAGGASRSSPPASSAPANAPALLDDVFLGDGLLAAAATSAAGGGSDPLLQTPPAGTAAPSPEPERVPFFNVAFVVSARHSGGAGAGGGGGGAAEHQRELLSHDTLLACVSDVASRVAACLRYEEERCGYVSEQAAAMMAASMVAPGGSGSTSGKAALASDAELLAAVRAAVSHSLPRHLEALLQPPPQLQSNAGPASSPLPPSRVLAAHPALSASSLARELFAVFHCLAPGAGSVAHVRFNGWIAASLSLRPAAAHGLYNQHPNNTMLQQPLLLSPPPGRPGGGGMELDATSAVVAAVAGGVGDGTADGVRGSTVSGRFAFGMAPGASAAAAVHGGGASSTMARGRHAPHHQQHQHPQAQPIRPYHTLLLLREAGDILAGLPPDASPQLAQLLAVASPLRSFHELQGETGIPSSQLLRLAGHLVHWGLALITNVVTQHSVYTVAPGVDLSPTCPAAVEFARLFGAGSVVAANGGGGRGAVCDDDVGFTLPAVLALFSKTTSTSTVLAPGLQQGGGVGRQSTIGGGAGDDSDGEDDGAPPQPAQLVLPTGSGLPLRTLMASMPPGSATYHRFLDALTWLLTRGYLRQMHTCVYLLWPWPLGPRQRAALGLVAAAPPPAAAVTADDGAAPADAATTGDGDGSVVPWSAEELAYLAALCRRKISAGSTGGGGGRRRGAAAAAPDAADAPPSQQALSLVALFRRLVAYLRDVTAMIAAAAEDAVAAEGRGVGAGRDDGGGGDGEYGDLAFGAGPAPPAPPSLALGLRLEEVMWRLRVSRPDLQAVMSAFPEVLLVSIHE